ncbi:MAG: ExbD/TolR family protein [Aeromonadaceae bacterium]
MAFGRLSSEAEEQPLSEINMIPMIDVMLVLLIVFMITAPLLTHAVKMELPQASSQPNQPKAEDIKLSITADGTLHWNGTPCDEGKLVQLMTEAAQNTPLPELQLSVDQQVDYGRVAKVMALASSHGLHKLAFVSQPEKGE